MKLESLVTKFAIEFEFSHYQLTVADSDRKKIAVLYLKEPIPTVEGSQIISDEEAGIREKVKAYDVETVRIHQDDFAAANVTINEDGSGSVKCDLILDVSKRTREVWIKSISFARFRANQQVERNAAQNRAILGDMQARKASKLLAGNTSGDTATQPAGKLTPEAVESQS